MKQSIVNRLAIFTITALALALPATGLAADLEITEIMYDAEGTDSGREWLEVYNTTGAAIELSDWIFFENDTNHGITERTVGAKTTVGSRSYAVIAADPDKFLADYPSFSGVVVDSAFTLLNSGETIALTTPDPENEVVSAVSYDPADGADGDGNSLQFSGSSWIAAGPTPGDENATQSEPTSDPDDDSDDDDSGSYQVMKAREEDPGSSQTLSFSAGADIDAVVGVPVELAADISGPDADEYEASWSLGNGASRAGDTTSYTYQHPGRYVARLMLTYEKETSSDDVVVDVITPTFELSVADGNQVQLENNAARRIDLSGYRLESAADSFTFPAGTIQLSGQTLVIASAVSGFSAIDSLTLHQPDGGVVASSSASEASKPAPGPSATTYLSAPDPKPAPRQAASAPAPEPTPNPAPADEAADSSTTSATSSLDLSAAADGSDQVAGVAASRSTGGQGSAAADIFWQWAGLLVVLLVTVVGTTLLLRRVSKPADDPAVQASQFDIN